MYKELEDNFISSGVLKNMLILTINLNIISQYDLMTIYQNYQSLHTTVQFPRVVSGEIRQASVPFPQCIGSLKSRSSKALPKDLAALIIHHKRL